MAIKGAWVCGHVDVCMAIHNYDYTVSCVLAIAHKSPQFQ